MTVIDELDTSEYRIEELDTVITPALAIYPKVVQSNIERTIRLLQGDTNRWRPHLKTAKVGSVVKQYISNGVVNFKCTTSLELLMACRAGAKDILVAYPVTGASVTRVAQIANMFPELRISALVEEERQIAAWSDTKVSLFIDLNPGMNRTGIEQHRVDAIVALALAIQRAGRVFRGLHYYDGHLVCEDMSERTGKAHDGYRQLCVLVDALLSHGIEVSEVITGGSYTFPCSLSYSAFGNSRVVHRVSPGTVVYCDSSTLRLLPASYGYRPAALVVAQVVSHPSAELITCDAGHKTVSADKGSPTCAVLGQPALKPMSPSEEHLPIAVLGSDRKPRLGSYLQLIPTHVCPTVNNFDRALIIIDGRIAAVEAISARGREGPIFSNIE
jgi:D-serine deaminase-like pyridoxal phosphate-dependent protein